MKKNFIFLFIIFSFAFFGFFACDDRKEPDQPEFDDNIILHTKWPFALGVAVPGAATSNTTSTHNNALNTNSRQHQFLKHFNVVVAENEMKPDQIMPTTATGSYRWTNADALVNYAKANDKRIRGHVLIWHDQTPSWFFSGSGVSGRATKEQLYQRMENHIKTVFEKYGGTIDTWDVVNEAVNHDQPGPRSDSMYTRIMQDSGLTGMARYEYVIKAFEWARKYADANNGQNVKLYLTDFGIERPFDRGEGAARTSKQADFEALVNYLIQNNAPIDGVGFQGHFRLYDHPVEQISDGIDRFAKIQRDGKNLMVQVCELDFSIFSNAKGEGSNTRIAGSLLNERLSDLAKTYRDFFDMFEKKFEEGKLDMVLIWGISDGHSWLNNHPVPNRVDHPLLFNRNYRAKEAYMALVEDRPDFVD
jgi:endo-1,4-beta-xylanase